MTSESERAEKSMRAWEKGKTRESFCELSTNNKNVHPLTILSYFVCDFQSFFMYNIKAFQCQRENESEKNCVREKHFHIASHEFSFRSISREKIVADDGKRFFV